MRIAIINMPVRAHMKPNTVPLGIYHLGAAVKFHRPEAEVAYLDLNLIRPSDRFMLNSAMSHVLDYDIYMLSGLITTLEYQRAVVKLIRAENPMAYILSGGGLATNCFGDLRKWMGVDCVYSGEAEEGIKMILDAHASSTEWAPELFMGSSPEDLDNWSVDWRDVVGLEQYIREPIWGSNIGNSSSAPFTMKRSLNLITSRGCPMQCKFCSHEATGGRDYRMRSPQSVVEESTRLIRKYELDFIGFLDDNMLVASGRNREIARGLMPMADTRSFTWGCHARFDFPLQDLPLLVRSGLRYIGFGGESANRDILKKMKKRNDPDQMIEVLKACREMGVHPNVTWMMGWPGETLEQIQETVQFILEHAPENKRMFVATAYPGTELWSEVKDKVLAEYTLVNYVRALGDATAPLMNYTDLPDVQFYKLARLAATGDLEGMLR